jgi:3-hydroxyisobutyrate dehydrogenase
MKIAFIGLGNMGGGMAANLVKAGMRSRLRPLAEAARPREGQRLRDLYVGARSGGQGADAVVSMLPNGKPSSKSSIQCRRDRPSPGGALLLDCSTIDVATAREVADACRAAGYAMVDAPVSGGIAAANGGTLTFMVGGTDEAFARAEPILAAMGKAVIHAGASGAGRRPRSATTCCWAPHDRTCEALAGEKLGLDLQTFYDISSKASGQNWSMTSYCPVPGVGPASPADNGYQGGFAAALMLKDLKLAMAGSTAPPWPPVSFGGSSICPWPKAWRFRSLRR